MINFNWNKDDMTEILNHTINMNNEINIISINTCKGRHKNNTYHFLSKSSYGERSFYESKFLLPKIKNMIFNTHGTFILNNHLLPSQGHTQHS